VINLKKYTPFIAYLLANSFVIYFANLFYPDIFVIGSSKMGYWLNLLWAGFWLTLILLAIKLMTKKPKSSFKGTGKGMIYWFFWNSFAIWLVAKLAVITGFGIPKFYWAVVLGFFTNFAQWLMRQCLKACRIIK
jgi:hypothetical protein